MHPLSNGGHSKKRACGGTSDIEHLFLPFATLVETYRQIDKEHFLIVFKSKCF